MSGRSSCVSRMASAPSAASPTTTPLSANRYGRGWRPKERVSWSSAMTIRIGLARPLSHVRPIGPPVAAAVGTARRIVSCGRRTDKESPCRPVNRSRSDQRRLRGYVARPARLVGAQTVSFGWASSSPSCLLPCRHLPRRNWACPEVSRSERPFVEWLDGEIAARGTSWCRLVEDAGISPSALSALWTGKDGRPAMETCYRLAGYLRHDLGRVRRMAGYEVPEQQVDVSDPELNLMFHGLLELTPEERECVKEFLRFATARSAASSTLSRVSSTTRRSMP